MIIVAAIAFAVFVNMTNLYKSFYLNFKPFNCVPCLSVWSALVLFLMPEQMVSFVATVFVAGVLGGIIYRLLLKL
jgi:hypothetical protein